MSCIKDILFFKCFSLGSFQGMLYNFSKKFLDVQNTHLVRALMHVAARSTSSLEHGGNMLLYSKISSCQRDFSAWILYLGLKTTFYISISLFPLTFQQLFFPLRKLSWRAINSPTTFVRFRWSCILAYILVVNYLMHGRPCLIKAPTTFLSLYLTALSDKHPLPNRRPA